ncbi:MAG: serpin family protein [Cyanobacteria bacterium P01_G01_bin.54]
MPEIDWADPYPAQVIQGNNTFALDLFRKLVRDQESDTRSRDSNLFFCSYSILAAFVMAYAGARATTAAQIAETLYFPPNSLELHHVFAALMQTLEKAEAQYQLTAANKFWMKQNFRAEPAYLDLLRQYYDSEVGRFKDVADLQVQANDWVAEQTQNKIPAIFRDEPNPSTKFVLLNAVYFKATWLEPFDKDATKSGQFHLLNGSTIAIDMMYGVKKEYTYQQFPEYGLEVIELPYKGGTEDDVPTASMAIILPARDVDIRALCGTLTYELIQSLLSAEDEFNDFEDEFLYSPRSETLHLTMPKFKLSSLFSIRSSLCGMGITQAFDEANANFSGINPLAYLFEAQHATFLEVNEETTEAAGATALSGGTRSAATPIEVTVDRPFILLILDASTRAPFQDRERGCDRSVLFAGRILDPSQFEAAELEGKRCQVDPHFR